MRLILFLFAVSCFPFFGVTQPDTLTVGYNIYPPFVYEKDGELDGVSTWLWNQVTESDTTIYEYIKLPLDSLIDGLTDGSVDVCLSPLTITSVRSNVMDFSVPYYIANATVMTTSASTVEKALAFLASFFSINFFRALFALFFVIFIFGFFVWLFERRKNTEEFDPGWKGIWSGIWWSAVTMTTVGYGDKSPQTTGGRIIALIWMFAAIILISGFTASIASSLTVNQLAWSQTNINDFKEKRIGTIQESATEEWLQKHFFKKVQRYGRLESCIGALRDGEIEAVAYDEPYLHYLLQTDSLSAFELLPISYNLQLYAMAFSEQLPMQTKEHLSNRLLEVTESNDWKVVLAEFDLLGE